jgi:hypothetical protein
MTFAYDPNTFESKIIDAKQVHTATAAPTTAADTTAGYAVGQRWLNTSTGKVYVCVDNTASAAVWDQEVLFASDGSLAVTAASNKNISLTVSGTGKIILSGVPSSDPSVAGALYTSTGALKVSGAS